MSETRWNRSSNERSDNSEIQHRRVVIENSHGEKLVGVLHDTGSTETVVICHGFRSSKDRIPMPTIANFFEKAMISSFRFDFAGNGESQGSFEYGNYHREAEDLRSILQHLRGENRGSVVLLYAAKYKDVQTVVNISGRFFLERGIEMRLGKDYLKRIKENGFIDVRNRKGKFEYRGANSSWIKRYDSACNRSIRIRQIHNHKLCLIEGADHEFTSHQHQLASTVLSFFKLDLKKADDDVSTSNRDHIRSALMIKSRI
ncbi:hypothetical protein YC2023_123956 [Brassica napus]